MESRSFPLIRSGWMRSFNETATSLPCPKLPDEIKFNASQRGVLRVSGSLFESVRTAPSQKHSWALKSSTNRKSALELSSKSLNGFLRVAQLISRAVRADFSPILPVDRYKSCSSLSLPSESGTRKKAARRNWSFSSHWILREFPI